MAEKGEELSDREKEVLQQVLDGAGNKEIAAALDISHNTVKVHLRNIYIKLDVKSRTEATTVALQQGLVTLVGVTSASAAAEDEAEPASEEPVEDTAVSPPSEPIEPLAEAEPLPRPPFVPRHIAVSGLLLFLLVALVFVSYQAFGRTDPPTTSPEPSQEPFLESQIADDWLLSRPLPDARASMAFVSSGLNLYLIGGEVNGTVTNAVSILDTATLTWREGLAKPTAVSQVSGAELFGEIYVPGGMQANGQPTKVVEVYSPANDSWRNAPPLPTAVSGGLVVSDGGFIYIFGGWDGETYHNTAYRYDPAASGWQILPPMPTARAFTAGGLVKGKLYVVGGYDGKRPLTECTYFDPTINFDEDDEIEGRWDSCADTLQPRAGAGATSVFNNLYLFGGGAFTNTPLTYSEVYNPDADQWTVVNTPPLDETPSWSNLGIANIEINIYAVGGIRGNEASAAMFVYQPFTYQTYIPVAPIDGNE